MHIQPRLDRLIILIISAALGLAATPARAQQVVQRIAPRQFSIGFLDEGSDFEATAGLMADLRRYLLARPELRQALRAAGYDGQELRLAACNGAPDQVQRMAEGEFDLAFSTAVVYARHVRPYAESGAAPFYEPILQSYRPDEEDFRPPGGGGGVLRQGVIFVGLASPLMHVDNLTSEAIQAELIQSALAVPSSDSAAGYVYPRVQMARTYGVAQPAAFWFCGSDAEVVKHVVTGLARVGACREGTLDALLGKQARRRYVNVLFQTLLYPTDPIVLRRDLLPAVSPLGQALKSALREYFLSQRVVPGLRVEDASRREYEKLAGYLTDLDRMLPGMPGGPPTRPAASAAGTTTPTMAPATPALPDRWLNPVRNPIEGVKDESDRSGVWLLPSPWSDVPADFRASRSGP
jgi:hypothetical protein